MSVAMARRRPSLRGTVLAVLGLPLCFSEASAAEQVPLGCFLYGWKVAEALSGISNPVNASDAVECQKKCAATDECKSFGFQTSFNACWLGSDIQTPSRALSNGFVAGPAKCVAERRFLSGLEASPACTASPSIRFPGRTAGESASTFTSGMVPVPLQCWPHYAATGKPALCKGSLMQVLEDSATGWPGNCLGLHFLPDETSETCETSCRGNVSCSTFQVVETDAGMLECWQGTGYDCFRDNVQAQNPEGALLEKEKILAAKRFLRGRYRVLKDLRGFEVTGLQYAFGKEAFGSDVEQAVMMCNHTCLSLVTCQAWRYSTGDGCWFDRGELVYPPTTDTFMKGTEAAALVVAGAYVQRLCEVPQDLHEVVSTSAAIAIMTTPEALSLSTLPLSTLPPPVLPPVPPVAALINATALPDVPGVSGVSWTLSTTHTPSTTAATAASATVTTNGSASFLPAVTVASSASHQSSQDTSDRFPGTFLRVLSSGLVFYKSARRLPGGERVVDQCRAAASVSEEEVISDSTGQAWPESGAVCRWVAELVGRSLVCFEECPADICSGPCPLLQEPKESSRSSVKTEGMTEAEEVDRCPELDGYLPRTESAGLRE
ncbi:unnamed protein product [Symbiodinium sp. CCMP2592]|nr:unnamed protein product [Symbiodinium sp. CCMP2592]